jgi:DnaJ homolog subfamily C member 7
LKTNLKVSDFLEKAFSSYQMKGLFASKKPSRKHPTGENDENISSRSEPASPARSPSKPTAKQPHKKSASTAEKDQRPNSVPRTSRSFGRPTDSSSSSRRKKPDPVTHPLNLPPDEYKRLSALSAMSNRSSLDADKMDVDREASSAPPSSPPPPAKQPSLPHITIPVSSPTPNGNKDAVSGERPVPPPHKSNPSSPVPTTAEEAEEYKNAGNKFFKSKDYRNAIIQYSKGMSPPTCAVFRLRGLVLLACS